jgi:hypothetical protein
MAAAPASAITAALAASQALGSTSVPSACSARSRFAFSRKIGTLI